MALCKATILVGALLLVPTLLHRINRVNELVIKDEGDGDTQKSMTQMVERDREELAEALVEENVYKEKIGKEGEDAAGEAVADLGDAFAGSGVPRGSSAKPLADAGKDKGKDAVKDKGKDASKDKGKSKEKANGKDKDEGKDKGKDASKDKGRDTGKFKGKDAGQDKGKLVSKDKEHQLVKSKGNEQEKGKLIFQSKDRPKRKFQFLFRFPVWGGKWWISRLAFLRGPFVGFIYQEAPATKTLLIKSWKALEEFGDEAIIPLSCNYVGARVGDKITFDVKELAQEGEGKPRPMAKNVIIRERGHAVARGLLTGDHAMAERGPALKNVRSQVLYYISDENLRTDKFFQDVIASSEGGWISTQFFLRCRRLKQLGASAKSIIESLQDVPGVEVRDMPGQEAVRRTSPHPALEAGIAANEGVALALRNAQTIAQHFAPVPALAKQQYTLEMMKSMGDPPVEETMKKLLAQGQEKHAKIKGPKANKQEQEPAGAEVEGPEPRSDKRMPRSAGKKLARERHQDASHAEDKTRANPKKEEKAKDLAKKAAVDKATSKKAAAEKPAAKKALAVPEQDAGDIPAAEKAAAIAKRSLDGQGAADTAATELAATEKAAEATSDSQTSWGSWFSKRLGLTE